MNRKRVLLVVLGLVILGLLAAGCATAGSKTSGGKGQTAVKTVSYTVRTPSRTFGLTDDNKACVACHQNTTPGIVTQWKNSQHYQAQVGCNTCHKAQKDDLDAYEHNGFIVSKHPNAADCQSCHAKQTEEFLKSKHAALGTHLGMDANMNWRKPPIYGKTMGCVACHAGMGNYWPDKTVGDCTSCHAKHEYSIAQARKPEACAQCHMGQDHGNWDAYQDSKHGMIWAANKESWDWNFKAGAVATPFDAPVCSTCHMEGAPGLEPTHDISARIAWRQSSPISFRTVWGGEGWQPKRARMEQVCYQCHSKPFVKERFLATDLAMYQYNEVYKVFASLRSNMNAQGMLTDQNDDDDPFDIALRELWHDIGRVYRASLTHFAPNTNEARGYSPMTYMAYELIAKAAEKGVPEAEKWVKENSKDKVSFYPWFDYGGSVWGNSNIALTNNYWYKKPEYWDKVKANVEFLHQKGYISDEQMNLWNEWYKTKDQYVNKTEADFPPQHKTYTDYFNKEAAAQKDVMSWKLPGDPLFKDLWEKEFKK